MTTASQPMPGRPRDPQKDVDVLQAARDLLVEHGYQATTIVAIARRAGVGAPTIYRRWPSREALIEDAAFGHAEPAAVPESTGDLRADLRAWVLTFLNQLADPVTRAAIPGLLLAYQREDGLYERLVDRSERNVRALLTELLGEHLPDLVAKQLSARADAVFDFMVATTMVRALTLGLAEHERFCDQTADALSALAYSTWQPRTVRRRTATQKAALRPLR
jgi:AcrR family transcriptional regulator